MQAGAGYISWELTDGFAVVSLLWELFCSRRGKACYQLSQKMKRCSCPVPKRTLKIYLIAFLPIFSNEFTNSMVFPFLPFMVKFFLPDIDDGSVGKYAGIIASSLFLGRIFGSYVWGVIADTKGRKPVLIVSTLLMGLFSAAFGFSVNFAMAVFFRFLVGITNGVAAASKAVLVEVSDDKTQAYGISLFSAAWGLGLIIGPAIAGATVDPIGQYNLTISNPTIRGFLTKFPFSLPGLVNLLIAIVGVLGVALFMPETLNKKKNKNVRPEKVCRKSTEVEECTSQTSTQQSEVDSNTSKESLLGAEEECDDNDRSKLTEVALPLEDESPESSNERSDNELATESKESLLGAEEECDDNDKSKLTEVALPLEDESPESANKCECEHSENKPATTKMTLAKSRRTSFLVLYFNRRKNTPSYMKVSRYCKLRNSASPGELEEKEADLETTEVPKKNIQTKNRFWESVKKSMLDLKAFLCDRVILLSLLIYCVFSFAFIGLDEVYPLWASAPPHLGGLGFSMHEIGISLAIAGAGLLPFVFVLFPTMERRFRSINTFQIYAMPLMCVIILLPNIHFLVPSGQMTLVWFLLCSALLITRVALYVTYSASAVFINNSVPSDKLGSLSGLAVALVAMFRMFSPVFVGGIFSASLSEETRSIGFPVDYHLVFIILGLVFLISSFMVACLPESINRQKVDCDNGDNV